MQQTQESARAGRSQSIPKSADADKVRQLRVQHLLLQQIIRIEEAAESVAQAAPSTDLLDAGAVNALAVQSMGAVAKLASETLKSTSLPDTKTIREQMALADDFEALKKGCMEIATESPASARRGKSRLSVGLSSMSLHLTASASQEILKRLERRLKPDNATLPAFLGELKGQLIMSDPNLTDATLQAMLPQWQDMHRLSLSGCLQITGKDLPEDTLSGLQSLDMSYTSLNDYGLVRIFNFAKNLCTLNIVGCEDVALQDHLDELKNRCIVVGPGEKESNASGKIDALNAILKELPDRTRRAAHFCEIADVVREMQSFAQLTCGHGVSWSSIERSATTLRPLVDQLPDRNGLKPVFGQLSREVEAKNLRTIGPLVKRLAQISDSLVKQQETGFGEWLRTQSRQHRGALYVQEKLELKRLVGLTDSSLRSFLELARARCPRLTELTVQNCPRITGESFEALGKGKLKKLNLQGIPNISNKGIAVLAKLSADEIELGTVSRRVADAIGQLPGGGPAIRYSCTEAPVTKSERRRTMLKALSSMGVPEEVKH